MCTIDPVKYAALHESHKLGHYTVKKGVLIGMIHKVAIKTLLSIATFDLIFYNFSVMYVVLYIDT